MSEATIIQALAREIKTGEPFEGLFPVHESVRREVAESMRRRGFDPAHPIVIWRERNIVIDGHTRLLAATDAGIETVPICFESFADEDAAVEYAIHCQRARRQHTDAELLAWIEALDARRAAGRKSAKIELGSMEPNSNFYSSGGRSADETAKKLGVSAATVKRARAVIDKADDETKAAIKRGEKTIRAAEREIAARDERRCKKCNAKLRRNSKRDFCDHCLGIAELRARPERAGAINGASKAAKITVEPPPDAEAETRTGKCPLCGSAAAIIDQPKLVAKLIAKHFGPKQITEILMELESHAE